MPFMICCDNKGCGKSMEPLLNLETNNVECAECGKVINSVTSFTKTQMKSLGQIKKDDKKQQAFSVQCKSCKKSSVPLIDGENILCMLCKNKLDISVPYANLIREKFKNK